jgi:hypothetical protein
MLMLVSGRTGFAGAHTLLVIELYCADALLHLKFEF